MRERIARYGRIAAAAERVDDSDLLTPDEGGAVASTWGQAHTARVDGDRVFVKRIPVTELELAHPGSTANLFGLPPSYHYGVGSAGFGSWRELAAHELANRWVLEDEAPGFPLLHHSRIVPRPASGPGDPADREGYLHRWGGDPAIAALWDARANAPFERLLVLEHIPDTARRTLTAESDWPRYLREMRAILAFVRARGVVHFDVHADNVLLRDGGPALTDFGLLHEPSFSSDDAEREFVGTHADYDLLSFQASLVLALYGIYARSGPDAQARMRARVDLPPDEEFFPLVAALGEHADVLAGAGLLPANDAHVAEVVRHRDALRPFIAFMIGLQLDPAHPGPYPSVELAARLAAVGPPAQ